MRLHCRWKEKVIKKQRRSKEKILGGGDNPFYAPHKNNSIADIGAWMVKWSTLKENKELSSRGSMVDS
jgi:hypothetical protein